MYNKTFDWYKLHILGCKLYDNGTEEDLRTAINRFYYGAFCHSRDYLISNKIFIDKKHKTELYNPSSKVHSITRFIFKNEKRKLNHKKGKKIHDYLYNLREYRNEADYNSKVLSNLNFMAKRSKYCSEEIFNLIREL